MHRCTRVTPINRSSLRSSGVSHHADIHPNGRGWKRTDEILHGAPRAKEALERWAPRPAAHRMIYSVWSARKHLPTYLGICSRRSAGLFDTAHVTDIFDLKESPIIGWLACLGMPDKVILPVRERAEKKEKCCTEKESRMEAVRATWSYPRLTWKKTIEKEVDFCQSSQTVPQRNSQSICQSWKKTSFFFFFF